MNGWFYGPYSHEFIAAQKSYGPENPLFSSCPTQDLQPRFLEVRRKMGDALRQLPTSQMAVKGQADQKAQVQ